MRSQNPRSDSDAWISGEEGAPYFVKIELDPDPLTGKRRQKWHSGYNTKREAEKARVDLLSKFDRGE